MELNVMRNLGLRYQAAVIHGCISLLVASVAASLVFLVWYPFPYREVSGGRELFIILMIVDIVLGPLLTLAIFNPTKPPNELRNDIAIVVLLQLVGLIYGLWVVANARPIHLVFEIDRFRVVHATDVPSELLSLAPRDVVAMPWTGPSVLSVRPFKSEREKIHATMAALQGVPLGARPDLWQTYKTGREQVLAVSRPASELRSRFVHGAVLIDSAIAEANRSVAAVSFIPMAGRKSFWTVLIDSKSAEVIGFVPLDSF
jgi:hypothetical protein